MDIFGVLIPDTFPDECYSCGVSDITLPVVDINDAESLYLYSKCESGFIYYI